MMYEIIEYRKDENGKEKQSACYDVPAVELAATMKSLDSNVKQGVISSYEIVEV